MKGRPAVPRTVLRDWELGERPRGGHSVPVEDLRRIALHCCLLANHMPGRVV